MKVVVDSSVFVSSLGIHDVNTISSREFFRKISTLEIILPTIVIAESLHTLHRQGNTKISSILKFFLSFTLIYLDQELVEQSIKYLSETLHLKTSDWLIATTANINRASLITWDEKLLKYSGQLCFAYTPFQFLTELSIKN